MRIAIIDDQTATRQATTQLLSQLTTPTQPLQVTAYPTAEAFLFADQPADLLLLDIKLGSGMDGMTLAKQIREHDADTAIAFVSNYDEFVFDGYDVNAIDYVIKPLTSDKLQHLITKVAAQTQPKLLAFTTANGIQRVAMYDISAIEVTDHCLQVHTQKMTYTVAGQLKEFLPQLDENFIQIYRSIVINLNFLSQLEKNTVVMADGTSYPVSRQQAPLVKRAFFKHFRGWLMTVNEWWWLAAFGLLTVGCCLLLWWTFRRQQNWPVRGLNLAVTLLALGGWWLWPLSSVRLVLFCSTFLTGSLEFVLMRQFLNDQDAVFARSLDKMMAQYSQEVQELYANMRGWRHDYHDHLQALKAYLDNQDTQAARAYLDELEDKLDEVDPLVHSGNAMLDAIVNAKLTLAERLHIPVNEKVIVGSTPLIKDVDLVVILGNLLDNAIEAISEQPAGEPRQLRLYIGIVKQQFYLSVTNTRPAEQEIDYQYASTKSDKRGLGIRRVNKLVAKYNGMINRQYEASVFVTEIAIPIHAVKSTTHA